jgi:hypothetical protein
MIKSFDEFGLLPDDKQEDIERKIQEKLGITFQEMHIKLAEYIESNIDDILDGLINIAPHGDYELLMEIEDGDREKMKKFLLSDVTRSEYWELERFNVSDSNDIKFVFSSKAVDAGDTFKGFVLVNFIGKILYAFCHGECS